MDEEKKVKKTKVQSMSKKVVIWIIVILSILFIVDIVRSSQNRTSSWIVTYMWKHYPYLIDAFSERGSSSSSSSDVAATEIEYSEEEESVVEEVVISPFNEDGFIFQDSSENYLDKESIYNLNDFEDYEFKDLLGYARNEIYARHGFAFKKNGKYDNFYTQYDWYNEIEHGAVSDSDLNEYEVANIDLIVQVEEKEGFR